MLLTTLGIIYLYGGLAWDLQDVCIPDLHPTDSK